MSDLVEITVHALVPRQIADAWTADFEAATSNGEFLAYVYERATKYLAKHPEALEEVTAHAVDILPDGA